jgi:putative nucleotidyltransferase with HDIG domain
MLRLGLQRVANLVFLATEKSRYVASRPAISSLMQALWQHSATCAMASEWIARKVRYPQLGETVFVGALVHDIGKLFLLRVMDEMSRSAPKDGAISPELMRDVVDQAHTEVGHRLLSSWHLPEVYQTIVRDHHVESPDPANVPLLIVRLANLACNKVGIGLRPNPSTVLGATPEASVLGISEIGLAELEIVLEDSLQAAG